jgi:fumarate reductase subunit C
LPVKKIVKKLFLNYYGSKLCKLQFQVFFKLSSDAKKIRKFVRFSPGPILVFLNFFAYFKVMKQLQACHLREGLMAKELNLIGFYGA